ncbi:hypothetical protein [Paenibacillus montanisoli]|uniref:Uncharacterized protein n=1 Tax=Paenibacillus montanisoli TaxID=2081970 RepID=A0A328U8R6_9BACL|nr:hypothetical protein [Paenibacillus montanisoli]RAP78243.1 hypothetical protein DL346_07395 [Paenibacillus montanisoli]
MIQYGSDTITQLKFLAFYPRMERRDDQWIDIELRAEVSHETPIPSGLIDLTILVICTHSGAIAQIIPLDEGCDCEFQFTSDEKEQIASYIESDEIQAEIAKLALS